MADFFQCDVASLLTTTETRFFDPFRGVPGDDKCGNRPACLYLRRPDADAVRTGRPVALRDNRAIDHVAALLRDCVQESAGVEESAGTREQFDNHLEQNCIVVGSPIVNPAAEMAICRAFCVEPFNPKANVQLPFTFKVAAQKNVEPSSILETSTDGKVGIWLRKEDEFLQASAWPREEFFRLRIREARDWAVVLVWNHQTADSSSNVRKLIVLSGFGGIGTEAAAKALVRHYRDLEPRDRLPVWGIVEAVYRKPANSQVRELLDYSWCGRKGGRCPVDFTKRRT